MRFALFTFVIAALSGIQHAVSLPYSKRGLDNETLTLILAAELELLEVAFYTQALQQLSEQDFAAANLSALVVRRYQEIMEHERKHSELLTVVLGPNAPQACNYSFPFNDVKTFATLSWIFEGVGASAYTGAMQYLSTPEVLTAASAILATESRQSSWIGTAVMGETPWGVEFETPLTARQAFTLASSFIVACPSSNPSLGLSAFPTLNISGTASPGQNLTVQFPPNSVQPNSIAFLSGLSTQIVPIDAYGNVTVPEDVIGQVYAIAISGSTEVSDSTTMFGPAVILVEKFANGTLTA